MTTRRELVEAIGERYGRANRDGKRQILDQFLKLTGYHRKHPIRVLYREVRGQKAKPGPQRRDNARARRRSKNGLRCSGGSAPDRYQSSIHW